MVWLALPLSHWSCPAVPFDFCTWCLWRQSESLKFMALWVLFDPLCNSVWKGIVGGMRSKMFRERLVVKWAILCGLFVYVSKYNCEQRSIFKASLGFGEMTDVLWPFLCPHLPFFAAYWQCVIQKPHNPSFLPHPFSITHRGLKNGMWALK